MPRQIGKIFNLPTLFKSTTETLGALVITSEAPVTAIPSEIADDIYWVTFGVVDNVLINGVESAIQIPSSSNAYIYVKSTLTQVGDEDDLQVTSASIVTSPTVITNTSTSSFPTDLHYLLGYVNNGIIANTGSGSINVHLIKQWTATSGSITRRYRYTFLR